MRRYSKDGALAFHTPGHKQGLGGHPLLKELITSEGLRREVSLMEELDDLHDPQTCIKEAQEMAAELWGADKSFFMVNGTTSAVQAMILSTLNPGDLVLVSRNAHRCVMSGLILSGARPIYLMPEVDLHFGISLNLTVETVRNAIDKYPQARALIIISPNYYGVAADLSAIAKLLHDRGMMLLVDEAHGAHLHFSDELPISAIDAGADLAAQSTHKLLGSLTQTSMLMVKSNLVDIERLKRTVSLLQSTSPNYLLLASLDIARLQMQEAGQELIKRAVQLSNRLRNAIRQIDGLQTFSNVNGFDLDLTKVTINVSELGMTGMEAEKILRYQYKIQCELSDVNNLLFLITFADIDDKIDRLIVTLQALSSSRRQIEIDLKPSLVRPIPNSVLKLTPREAFYSLNSTVDIDDAVNRICAEEVTFYPPGIPILQPGELITADIIDYIKSNKNIGRRLIGAADTSLNTIRILKSLSRRDS
ncbi:MAG: aminotransferase class I/II-fold pyridoxal phosphate-dependent enzyme [Selenomonadaceae bacterium]|nr:aminotransferase class I/II-fold pyridoxal phosphate-dependent enzyme [Selenomonadaceae bacterium]